MGNWPWQWSQLCRVWTPGAVLWLCWYSHWRGRSNTSHQGAHTNPAHWCAWTYPIWVAYQHSRQKLQRWVVMAIQGLIVCDRVTEIQGWGALEWKIDRFMLTATMKWGYLELLICLEKESHCCWTAYRGAFGYSTAYKWGLWLLNWMKGGIW